MKLSTWTLVKVGLAVATVRSLYLYQPQRLHLKLKGRSGEPDRSDFGEDQFFCKNARVALVIAHPDDAEFFVGGTLARLAEAGAEIQVIVCTDGDKGYYPKFLTDARENRRVRRLEQFDSAAQYGAEVCFLGRRDGRLKADGELIREIAGNLAEFEPEFVLTFDDSRLPRIQHQDHVVSGYATRLALMAVPSVRWLMRFSSDQPNYFADITTYWTDKLNLLAIHKSQFQEDRLSWVTNFLKNRAEADGQLAGVKLAEGYRVEYLGN